MDFSGGAGWSRLGNSSASQIEARNHIMPVRMRTLSSPFFAYSNALISRRDYCRSLQPEVARGRADMDGARSGGQRPSIGGGRPIL